MKDFDDESAPQKPRPYQIGQFYEKKFKLKSSPNSGVYTKRHEWISCDCPFTYRRYRRYLWTWLCVAYSTLAWRWPRYMSRRVSPPGWTQSRSSRSGWAHRGGPAPWPTHTTHTHKLKANVGWTKMINHKKCVQFLTSCFGTCCFENSVGMFELRVTVRERQILLR